MVRTRRLLAEGAGHVLKVGVDASAQTKMMVAQIRATFPLLGLRWRGRLLVGDAPRDALPSSAGSSE